jgi:glycosyltransferase involved in cell wall biosynthesis
MENKPLVSVLIPCYNVAPFVTQAIDSIINQTYKNIELIIINDGSTDDTFEKLKEFEKKDSRVKLYNNEINIGLIKTLNKGIDLCNGLYISRFDADDIMPLNRIEKQIAIVNQNLNIELITSYLTYVTPNGNYHSKVESFYGYTLQSAKFISLFETPLAHPGMFIKTSVLRKVNFSDNLQNQHIEDYDLFSNLLFNNINLFVQTDNKDRYFYRRNPNSVSNNNKEIQNENSTLKAKHNIFKIFHYNVNSESLDIIILKKKINWDYKNLNSAISLFKKLKFDFFNLKSNHLDNLDKKIITEWVNLRILKIIVFAFINGDVFTKANAVIQLFKNINMFTYKKTYYNLINRMVFISNKIRYNN